MASTTGQYGVFPRPSHDEAARQRYAMGLRRHLFGPLREAIGRAFHASAAQGLGDRHDARREALKLPSYQYFSDLHRISQEMIWGSVLDTLDRTEQSLRERYRGLGPTLGSIRLDPALEIPRYLSAIDIHCMPGNYQRSAGEDDLVAGALYDRGGYLYSPNTGFDRGGIGHTSLAFLRERFPRLGPRRILDLGCGIGGPTVVHAAAFPAAEVHAIDIGAGMLRYGHLRAETQERRVHFSQQNAERTDFAAGSFDLVLSHILFHETSAQAVPAILAECRRLLAPGGVMLHLDLPRPERLPDLFTQVIFDGDAYYNNEPFWMRMHELDWPAMMERAGFGPDRTLVEDVAVQMSVPPTAEHPEGRWAPGRLSLTAFAASVPAS